MTAAFKNPPWEAWADPAWGNPGPRRTVPRRRSATSTRPASTSRCASPLARPARSVSTRTTSGSAATPIRATAKPAGTRRVVVLGDSHTDGYVDNAESFATVLEARLRERLGPSDVVEVLNAGVVGYSPAQEYLWYAVRGVALAPDVVVLVLYAGNDVSELADPSKPASIRRRAADSRRPRRAGRRRGTREVRSARSPRRAPRRRVDARAVRFGPLAPLWRRFDLPGAVREVGDFHTDTLIAVLRACHGCFWQSLQQAARAERHPERTHEDIGRVADLAIALDRRVRADGARLVVADPAHSRAGRAERADAERTRVADLLGIAPASLGFEDEVVAELARRLDAAGVAAVSLLEPLRQAAPSGAQYYERDWHLDPLGHRTVAAALEASVMKTFQSAPAHASR